MNGSVSVASLQSTTTAAEFLIVRFLHAFIEIFDQVTPLWNKRRDNNLAQSLNVSNSFQMLNNRLNSGKALDLVIVDLLT